MGDWRGVWKWVRVDIICWDAGILRGFGEEGVREGLGFSVVSVYFIGEAIWASDFKCWDSGIAAITCWFFDVSVRGPHVFCIGEFEIFRPVLPFRFHNFFTVFVSSASQLSV